MLQSVFFVISVFVMRLSLVLKRDEEVGVYGFIFFRDSSWVTIIIDECVLLFHSVKTIAYE